MDDVLKARNTSLLPFSGEFDSQAMEASFFSFSWPDIRKATRYTLWVIAFMGMAFVAVDVLVTPDQESLYRLLALRFLTAAVLVMAAEFIHRRGSYFSGYPYLLVSIEVGIATAVFFLAVLRKMPAAYMGVNTILLTLIYYQFMIGRFEFTVAASVFLGCGAIAVGFVYLQLQVTELIGSFLFLIPLNFLGIAILRSNNRSKRHEYLSLIESERLNREKENLIQELQAALTEVKTLQGFIPICASCHKIRNDKGFWERIEKYIQDRTNVQFSHSLCPECARKFYKDYVEDR